MLPLWLSTWLSPRGHSRSASNPFKSSAASPVLGPSPRWGVLQLRPSRQRPGHPSGSTKDCRRSLGHACRPEPGASGSSLSDDLGPGSRSAGGAGPAVSARRDARQRPTSPMCSSAHRGVSLLAAMELVPLVLVAGLAGSAMVREAGASRVCRAASSAPGYDGSGGGGPSARSIRRPS